MIRRFICTLALVLAVAYASHGQMNNVLMNPQRALTVPFSMDQDFIIVEVTLADRVPLKLLLDTGSEYTVIFSKFLTDLLGIQYHREIELLGSDLSRTITAYITERVNLDLSPHANISRSLLVLDDGAINMDKMLGMQIDGILGIESFKNTLLHIDYNREKLRIYPSREVDRITKNHQQVGSFFDSHKPYTYASISVNDQQLDSLLLLLDSGSAIPFLLHDDTLEDFALPEDMTSGILGVGLGGYVEGYKGRINEIEISDIKVENVVSSFHKADSSMVSRVDFLRNGLIGNSLLKHMDPIIDFTTESLYLNPDYRSIDQSRYDRSGLFVIASGLNFGSHHVIHVAEGSPAQRAGVQRGDIIRRINSIRYQSLTIDRINRRLQGRVGKKIRMTLLRGDRRVDVSFELEDII